jgi:superfamily II DNA/RNA helicase
VPTRELALQVADVLEPVAQATNRVVLPVYGGASRQQQIDELQRVSTSIVATPCGSSTC